MNIRMIRCVWLLFLSIVPAVYAGDLEVRVVGSGAAEQLVCALFASAAGFPVDSSAARRVRARTTPTGPVCEFRAIPAGQWAVAVLQDENHNDRVDTSFLGVPTEAWGVSGNVRHALRAPRFSEAMFTLTPTQTLALTITVAK